MRRSSRRGVLHGSAWAMVLGLAVLVLGTPAQAQTSVALVSNEGQSGLSLSNRPQLEYDLAQGFTTGSETLGYKMTSVGMRVSRGAGCPHTVTLHATASLNRPAAAVLATLSPVTEGVSSTGPYTQYNAAGDGIDLDRNTDYAIRINSTSDCSSRVNVTQDPAEDSGAATGWSIHNTGWKRNWNSTSNTIGWSHIDTSRNSAVVQITIYGYANVANNAPTASAGEVTTNEDTDYTFTAANFNFSDTDTDDVLSSVSIETLPASGKGSLTLSGTAVSAGDDITKANIDAGNLKYSPPANSHGNDFATFTFKVSDGTDESAASYTMTIDVTSVADPAQGAPAIVGEGISGVTLSLDFSGIQDGDGLPATSTFDIKWYHTDDAATVQGTAATYALSSSDVGKKLRVVVGFTDLDSNAEEVSLASWPATGTIAPALTFSVSPTTLYEDGRVATVTIATVGGVNLDAAKTVNLTITGTATKGTDYTIASESLEIASGANSATTTITTISDDVDDDAETVILAAATAAGTAIGTQQTVTIQDPPTVNLSMPADAPLSPDLVEGQSVNLQFVLSAAPGREVSIPINFREIGGVSSLDYTAARTVTFGPAQTLAHLTVTTFADDVADPGEFLRINVDQFANLPVGIIDVTDGTSYIVDIVDDDFSYNVSHAGGTAIEVNEEAGTLSAVVRVETPTDVRLNAGTLATLAETVTVSVSSADGTAVAGQDYTAVSSQSLSFSASDFTDTDSNECFNCARAEKTVSVSITDDSTYEGNTPETFTLTLSHSSGQRVTYPGNAATATVSIIDNEQPSLTFSVEPTQILENGGTATVTLATSDGNAIAADADIDLMLSGTATKGTDYSIGSESLTLTAGQSSITTTITATNDSTDDDNETVVVSAAVGGTAIGSAQTVTIIESLPALSISVNNADIAEDGGTSTVTVGTGSGPTFLTEQTITLALTGTATLTDDYTINRTTLTLPAGSSSVTATVTAVHDIIDDEAETVVITATHNSSTIGSPQTITITDDDATPTLAVSVNNATIAEAGGASTLTVSTGTTAFATEQTITLALTGTATRTDDYTIDSTSLMLPAGSTSVTATVTAVDDLFDDEAETVLITATHSSGTIGSPQTVTITDDDVAPALTTVSVNNADIVEAGGASTVTVSTNGSAFTTNQTITLALTGTATRTDDYTIDSTSLTLTAGSTSVMATVTAVQDNANEGDETVLITATHNSNTIGTQQTITITDDDTAPTFRVSVNNDTIAEAGGASSTLTVSITGSTFAGDQTITLTVGGTATEGTDYTIGSKSLTLTGGATSTMTTVTGVDDRFDDDDETVLITASHNSATIGTQQTITITDDDAAPVINSLSVSRGTVAESGGTITVTVSTNGSAFTTDQTITLTIGGTATKGTDFTIGTESLTLTAGETSAMTTITATSDSTVDDSETITISAAHGANTVGSQQTVTISENSAPTSADRTVTIDEDTTHSFGASDFAFTDADAGAALASVTIVTLPADGSLTLSGAAVTADQSVTAADITAGNLSFAPVADGFSNLLDPDGDPIPGTAYATFDFKVSDGTVESTASYTVTIEVNNVNDDPTGTPTISGVPRQGATLTLDISQIMDADGLPDVAEWDIQWLHEDDNSFACPSSGLSDDSLTCDLEHTGVGEAIIVEVGYDDLGGTEKEFLESNRFPATGTIAANNAPVVATAIPDQSATVGVAFRYQIPAGTFTDADSDTLTYSAEKDGTPRSPLPTWLSFDPTTLTFTGTPQASDAETLTVSVRAADAYWRGAVRDEFDIVVGEPTLSVSVDPAEIVEAAGTSTVTVSASAAFGTDQTITLALGGTATQTDDYTIDLTSLTLTTGSTSVTATVTAVQDTIDEADETVLITATHNGNTIGTQQTITITDDDTAPTFAVSVNNADIAEAGGTSTLTVSISGSTFAGDQTITLSVGGTATEGSDYTIGSKSLTLTGGATSTMTTVTAVDDLFDDDDETVLITAAHNSSTIGTQQTITITDDDAAPTLSVSVNNDSIVEASGASTLTVSTGSTVFANDQTITLTIGGTATKGTDYTIDSESLTLTASSTSVTATVTAVQDIIDDEAETVLITAMHSGNTIGSQQTITIDDDDVAPTLAASVNNASIAEAGATSTLTVSTGTTAFASDQTITLSLGGTATGTDDYTIDSTSLTLTAGSTSVTAPVTAVQDIIDEPDETVLITATHSSGAIGSQLTVTITDDDNAPVLLFEVDDANIGEAAETATLTVRTGTGSTFVDNQTINLTLTGTATGTDDYTVESISLVLPAGSGTDPSSITTTISTVQDKIDEPDEMVLITAARGSATVGSQLTVTITDDDDVPVLALNVSLGSITEAAGASTVTITTGTGSTFATGQTIALTLGGTATVTDDFTIGSTSLALPAGVGTTATEITTTITAVDDDVFEGTTNEFITVTAARGGNNFGSERTITINENEARPRLILTLVDDSIAENGGSTGVTARVEPRTVDAFTVDLTTTPNAPATAADYTLAGSISFVALSATSTGTATITAHDNRVDRPDKTVGVTATSSLTYFQATEALTLTLEDEDAAPAPVVRITGSPLAENGGQATIEVTTGTGSTFPDVQTVVLTLSGTAIENTDYSILSKTLTLPAGSGLDVSAVDTTVSGIDDIIDDDDNILVDAAIGGATIGSQQTISITDDDAAPTVTVGVSPASISENGGAATVTVTTDTGSSTFATDQTITLALAGTAVEDVDYSIVAKSLTLPAGVGSSHASVDTSITGLNDAIDEADTETILISATRGSAAVGTQQTLGVSDDDAAPVLLFTASSTQIAEAGGASTLTVSTGTGSTFEFDQTITLTVTDDTAILNSDYSVSETTLTLPAGEGLTATQVTSTVTGLDDGLFEGQVDQTLTVSAARGAATVGTPIALAVADDEAPSKPVITVSEASIPEGGISDIAATVSPPAEVGFWLRTRFGGDFGRYVVLPEPGLILGSNSDTTYIEFAPGATTSVPRRLRVSAHTNDADDGDSQITLSSGAPVGFNLGARQELANPLPGIQSADAVTITIVDDDEGPTTVTLSVDVDEVDEGAGATTVQVTGTLSGEARSGVTDVTLSVGSGTTGTDAESGVDFAEVTDFELSIPGGQTSAVASFTLTPTEDNIDEADETLRVSGTSDDDTVGVTATSITITDNDEAPALALSVDPAGIDEAGGESVVTVSTGTGSTYASTQTVTLALTGTATQGGDYTVGPTTLILPTGEGTAASEVTMTITAVDDNIAEPAETVVISGTLDGEAFGTAQTVTITDNDGTPAVTLVLTPSTVFEGGASTVTATASPASSEPFQVTVSAVGVAPAGAGDFTLTGTTLSFAGDAAQSTGTVTIAATDDTLDNADRVVTVSGAVTSAAVTAPASVQLTINDDDDPAALTLDVDPDVIGEDGGVATLTVSTGGGATFATAQQIEISLGGTAVAGEDYTLGDASLTLAAGASSVSTTLTGLADDIFEGTETVTVSGLHNGAALGAGQTVTLIDGDTAPAVTLVLTPDLITENGGESTVTATLSTPSAIPLELTVSAEAVAPAVGADYTLEGGTLSFAANATESTGAVTVTGVDNPVDAPDKTVRIAAAVSDPLFAVPEPVLLTLEDDDEASSSAAITVQPDELSEGDGPTEFTVTATFSADASPTPTDFTVSVLGGGGASVAQPGVDFAEVNDFSLTIPANEISGTATFTLTPLQDNISEGAETLNIGTTPGNTDIGVTGTPSVTITDDDAAPSLFLSLSTDTIPENGGTATVTVTTGEGSTFAEVQTIELNLTGSATMDEDYTLSSTALSLPAGSGAGASSVTAVVTALDDALDEDDETVEIRGELDGEPFGELRTLTIVDDDEPPVAVLPTVTLVLTPPGIAENGGVASVTATASPASPEPFTVTIAAAAVAPAMAGDFTLEGGTLSFAADATGSTGEVTITAVDNNEDAPDKTVTVTGSVSLEGAEAPAAVTLTIMDDEEPPVELPTVTLVLTPTSISEDGGVARVTATASPASSEPFTLTIVAEAVAPAMAGDFTLEGGTLSFAADATGSTGEVTITAVDNDEDAPDKTVSVTGSVSLEGAEAPAAVTLTIMDDDEPPVELPTVTLVLTPTSITEDGGVATVTATASPASPEPFTVTIAAAAVDPAMAGDFTLEGGTLSFAADATGSTGEVTITAVDNDEDAPDKTVTVTGSVSLEGAEAPAAVTLTITDDDEPPAVLPTVTLVLTPTSITEDGGVASVTATASPASPEPFTVTIAAAAVTPAMAGDFTLEGGTLSFAADATGSTGEVTITAVDNDEDAPDKTVSVTGSVSLEGAEAPAAVTLTITDDDEPPAVLPTVTLVLTPTSITEDGGVASVIATASPASPEPFTVTITAAAVAPAMAGDFTLEGGTLSFAADATGSTGEVTITAVDNDEDAPDKTVTVTGSVSLEGAEAPAAVTLTIVDDDEPPAVLPTVTLVLTPPGIAENGGVATVTATASPAWPEPFMVTIGAAAVAPAMAGDFTLEGSTLSFAADATGSTGEVTITAVDNDEDAPDKTVTVTGSVSLEGAEAPAAVTLTIIDDDEPPAVLPELRIADAHGREADGQLVFELSLNPTAESAVSVQYATRDGSATAGLDYTAVAGTVTVEAGVSSARIVVPLLVDVVSESDETFQVTLSAVQGARLGDSEAIGIIEDDVDASSQWLAQMGRITGGHVMSAVERQISLAHRSNSLVTMAGRSYTGEDVSSAERFGEAALNMAQSVGWLSPSSARGDTLPNASGSPSWNPLGATAGVAGFGDPQLSAFGSGFPAGASIGPAYGAGFGSTGSATDVHRLLANSSFLFGADAGSGVAFWGSGDYTQFESAGEGLQSNGDVTTATLGLDYASARSLLGVAVSHSLTEATYGTGGQEQGTVEATLTGLYPYFAAQPSDRVTIWGLAGQGQGDMTAMQKLGAEPVRVDLTSGLAGLGIRGEMVRTQSGFTLALKSDGLVTRTSTDEYDGLLAGEGEYRRLRFGLEGAWLTQYESGTSLRTMLELAAREDGGDVENGLGAEAVFGLEWLDVTPGLSLSLGARGLLSHESEVYEETGYSAALRYDPTPGSDAGALVSLTRSWGVFQSNGLQQALWRNELPRGLVPHGGPMQPLAKAEFAWGFEQFGGLGVPWMQVGLNGPARDYSTGYRLINRRGVFEVEWNNSAFGRQFRAGWGFNVSCRLQLSVELAHTRSLMQPADTAVKIGFHSWLPHCTPNGKASPFSR